MLMVEISVLKNFMSPTIFRQQKKVKEVTPQCQQKNHISESG